MARRDEPVPVASLDAFFDQHDDALLLGAIGESIGSVLARRGAAALPPTARTIGLTNGVEQRGPESRLS